MKWKCVQCLCAFYWNPEKEKEMPQRMQDHLFYAEHAGFGRWDGSNKSSR